MGGERIRLAGDGERAIKGSGNSKCRVTKMCSQTFKSFHTGGGVYMNRRQKKQRLLMMTCRTWDDLERSINETIL